MSDPVEMLARPDKWYLSAADGIIFAPRFPRWLDRPGFWDGGTVGEFDVAPLFTVALLDDDGRELAVRAATRRWTPSELTVEYRLEGGVRASEVRTVQPGGVFASEWSVDAARTTPLHAVAWTVQHGVTFDAERIRTDGELSLAPPVERVEAGGTFRLSLAALGGATSWAVCGAEDADDGPCWERSPLAEAWLGDAFPGRGAGLEPPAALPPPVTFAAVHRRLDPGAPGAARTAAFALRVSPVAPRVVPPATSDGPPAATLAGASRRRWRELLARAPVFRCSDPYFEHYFWYRWYGLWLNALGAGDASFDAPAFAEGIASLHRPSATAAPCQVRELRWLDDPGPARGVLRTALAWQRADGSIPAVLSQSDPDPVGAVADWGGALLALDAAWPDDAFLREVHPGFARYAEWLIRERDHEASALFDADAFAANGDVASSADAVPSERWKGVATSAYACRLFAALASTAARAGVPEDAGRWDAMRHRTAAALRERMWDPVSRMFFDTRAGDGSRSAVRAASGFYAYLTDAVDDSHAEGFLDLLSDPEEFGAPFPVPTRAFSDRSFSADGVVGGVRRGRPGNGRVWPLVNSHVAEALIAMAGSSERAAWTAAAFLRRFVRMMFRDGHLERPGSFEHYNPVTGAPSLYRGLDDHQENWLNDLIVTGLIGVHPDDAGVTVRPLPLGLDRAELTNLHVRGMRLDVRIESKTVTVVADGVARQGTLGLPLRIPL